MKRFWDIADVAPHETGDDAGWSVRLDGKPVRVPGGGLLRLPNGMLAREVAAEWQAAGGGKGAEMSYDDLPLTRLAGTAQERVALDPGPVVLEIARYGQTDLLCYRADAPVSLVQRQLEQWQPWLDWAGRTLGAHLLVTTGIIHVSQPEAGLSALTVAVARLDAHRLAGLSILVPSFGSLVLGLAVAQGALSATEAHEIATLDERHQAGFWGWDIEAEKRMAKVAEDVAAAGRFLDLCAA
jgi:chaperone required for assembly of F1-ATPase